MAMLGETEHSIWAILPAAGSSSRMAKALAGGSKLFYELDGRYVLQHSIEALLATKRFSGLIVATQAEFFPQIEEIFSRLSSDTSLHMVEGGASRQDSVANALSVVPSECSMVAVHDGARPFCDPVSIENVLAAAAGSGAAILGVPSKATLKAIEPESSKAPQIRSTLDRSTIWEAQTPQVFACTLLREAHCRAQADSFSGTDEAQLVERLGTKVDLVPGSYRNIKITTPEDLQLAEFYLLQNNDKRLFPDQG